MTTPDDILGFWFPDGPDPEPEAHLAHWVWRMRGGSGPEVVARYGDLTARAVRGEIDNWADTPRGRLALIIVLDQFPRSVWAGTPAAFASDPNALAICLEGFDNGHFDALENVWFKSMYKLPLEHCECADHLAHLDRAIAVAEAAQAEAPDRLRKMYELGVEQPKKHRAVIAEFGRHSHRNAVLGRVSTPEELAYLAAGVFPHQTDLSFEANKVKL
jgi:uncharacterized protein (DUF924 family)